MRFLKLKEVMQKTALSRSAIYRKMNDNNFPQSINLGDRAVAWVDSQVDVCNGKRVWESVELGSDSSTEMMSVKRMLILLIMFT